MREDPDEIDVHSTAIAANHPAPSLKRSDRPRLGPPVQPGRPTAVYRPTARAPMAVIKLYHEGMRSFSHYPVMCDQFRIGRSEGDLVVSHDNRMSGRHAEIQRRADGDKFRWFLVDLDSTNGTFVRADRALLKNEDHLLIGKEYYRFVSHDGTSGLIHEGNPSGETWWFESNPVWLGRGVPCGLNSFTQDEFVDPKHAYITMNAAGEWIIKDAGSMNGVWYRIQEAELGKSCSFQLGEQRFGFWMC
jgi:hypothetical protein